ncbi:aromatic ring-hydroxylating oxygenase subunit alpha [Nocardioides bizhenqiangii]|uniref:SRPBCC family protein n=1 Tax=Nocardioides bizhenqiangii TaxID=3095076 RepID=A0ABZ0ZVL8_9ACTN|nr:SRPBCC family protein [Nocardioides sp. HM61]WQQ28278.1 SRPBCC family protein [Nocardioides sp. HM61]
MTVDPMEIVRKAAPLDGEPVLMMPAEAYTSTEVLAWERRHLFAGTWTCLGRVADLFPVEPERPVTQRALILGDIACLLVNEQGTLRMYANTCRHRGHELLPEGSSTERRSVVCPYHAWTYDLQGRLIGAKGFRDDEGFDFAEHTLAELPVRVWEGWVFGHALHQAGSPQVPSFDEHLGALDTVVAPYAPGTLVVGDRHTYEVAANWKVISENYHECYHCPLIHPELCQVSPPSSGDNYDLPGSWVGGSMDLRDGMRTMSLTGELAATPLPGAPPTTVEYLHLLPNLLVSAHPDYVMTHRMVPLAPDRTWVECSWLVLPGADGSVPAAAAAVAFWDLTNKQDWAACESVQRGLASPHFAPGPFAPSEDAVAQLVSMIGRAYRTGRLVA